MALAPVYATADETYSDYGRTPAISEFGSETSLWGKALTPEILNDPEFSIVFDTSGIDGTICVDDVTIEIFFTIPYTSGQDPADNPFVTDANPEGESLLHACAIGRNPSGAKVIVVVGKAGHIQTSHDNGATWITRNSGVAESLWDIDYSASEGFVAVGANGVVISSTDGEIWQEEGNQGTSGTLYAINLDKTNYEPDARAGREGVIFGGAALSNRRVWRSA